MDHKPTWIGDIFNYLFGGIVGPLMETLGIHPHDPLRPIPDHIAIEIFIFLLCIAFFLWFRRKLSADNPGGIQLAFESVLSNSMQVGIYDLIDEIIGVEGRKHLAVVGSVGLFIFFNNVISVIPDTLSPSLVNTVPLGAAVAVFLYYHIAGLVRFGGFGYAKQFIGHVFAMPKGLWPVMIPLFIVIETVSHLARMLSLTARLWANIFASELLYLTFLGLTTALFAMAWKWSVVAGSAVMLFPLTSPVMFPIVFVLLHVFVALVQAFVFTLLPIIYIGGATVEEH